jgi:hypothetical protein
MRLGARSAAGGSQPSLIEYELKPQFVASPDPNEWVRNRAGIGANRHRFGRRQRRLNLSWSGLAAGAGAKVGSRPIPETGEGFAAKRAYPWAKWRYP